MSVNRRRLKAVSVSVARASSTSVIARRLAERLWMSKLHKYKLEPKHFDYENTVGI